MTLDKH
jgi:hypothetical protein